MQQGYDSRILKTRERLNNKEILSQQCQSGHNKTQ